MRTFLQVIDVIHPGRASVAKSELKEKLAKIYKVSCSSLQFEAISISVRLG